ncbi:MAG: hypothetical protein V1909_03880 [Candidatus Micrarchaeota archaeon]
MKNGTVKVYLGRQVVVSDTDGRIHTGRAKLLTPKHLLVGDSQGTAYIPLGGIQRIRAV